MHRTEGTNHNGNMFTDGPPGTKVEQDWLNAVQEEIAYVIEQSGGTLKTAATETSTQLKAALDALYEPKSVAFDGALVYLSGDQTIADGVTTAILWDAEDYDTSEIHSLVTNTSRLTVPASVTKIQLFGTIVFDAGLNGRRTIRFRKNGSVFNYVGMAENQWEASTGAALVYQRGEIVSPVLSVSGGDYFELIVDQNNGGNLDVIGLVTGSSIGHSWFGMSVVEP